jgi:flavin reductase (DIM6/NTAB) family NADH-FMN oxidoreductase RutF
VKNAEGRAHAARRCAHLGALSAPLSARIHAAAPPSVAQRARFSSSLRLSGRYDAGMELDLEGQHASRAYPLLVSLITPRPIAWVTSIGADGVVNAAPFSFFNLLGSSPPILGVCPGDRADGEPKDSARNIRDNHEFVVNLVDEGVSEAMNRTAASLPYGTSEIAHAGLTTAPSSLVAPPRIAEAPASIECKEWGTLQIGDNRLIIGLVKRLHVRDELYDPVKQRIISERFAVIGRMASPNWYCRTGDRFEMVRPP